jgi:hypothetical protein
MKGPAWPDARDARACVSSPGFLPRGTHTVIAQRGAVYPRSQRRPNWPRSESKGAPGQIYIDAC